MAQDLNRIERKRRLDVQTWAGLDAIEYLFQVIGNGEAIAGPYYFGRAFTSPPQFSYSMVARNQAAVLGATSLFTLGVESWIKDEKGLYVGANIWIAFESCVDQIVSWPYDPEVPA